MNSLLRLAAYQIYLFQGQKDRSNAKPLYSFQLFHILYLFAYKCEQQPDKCCL